MAKRHRTLIAEEFESHLAAVDQEWQAFLDELRARAKKEAAFYAKADVRKAQVEVEFRKHYEGMLAKAGFSRAPGVDGSIPLAFAIGTIPATDPRYPALVALESAYSRAWEAAMRTLGIGREKLESGLKKKCGRKLDPAREAIREKFRNGSTLDEMYAQYPELDVRNVRKIKSEALKGLDRE